MMLNLSGEELCALEHALLHCLNDTIKEHGDARAISSPTHRRALQRIMEKAGIPK